MSPHTASVRRLSASLLVTCMIEARKKILCIDDDRETAALLVEHLAERGFEVGVAYDGQASLSVILQMMPDLVLCDINMPVMSGFELLELLRQIAPQFGHIPFVFLTGLTGRDDELKGRRLGADDYVTKPIDFEMLDAIIAARLVPVARNEIWPTNVTLNEREVEMLTWAARGKSSTEIAQIVGLTTRTVDFHIDNARHKLGSATRIEAAVKAKTGHLIKP